jgi:polar amino acid transport system permease protein
MTVMGPESADHTTGRPEALRAVPVRHPGRWISAAIILVLVAQLLHWLITNPTLRWDVVGKYLFNDLILRAVERTIELTVIAMVMGIVLGVILAVMRLSANPVVKSVSWVYIWFFRGTPVLVQLLFWYNIPTVVHSISLGIPFGPGWLVTDDPKVLITQWAAACLGLGLNEAAYMAEIARAGILSVDEGQVEAASALGMTRLLSMRRIVLPQAMRVIIPPTGNETISMLKTTSLAFVISFPELLGTVSIVYSRTFQTIPMLIVASIWYLFLTTILTIAQYYIERHYARGAQRMLPPTPLQRLRLMALRNPGGIA